MMRKFFEWFSNNRKPIGYTVGALNVLSGVNFLLQGDIGLAVLWFVIGGTILFDTYEYK
jgi:hypothetical protein